MIYNKETATRFLRCCKQPFILRCRSHRIEICDEVIRKISTQTIGYIGIDLEEWVIRGEQACVDWIWTHRGAINAHFRR